MPRICTSASDPLDFCKAHFPKSEAAALKRFGLAKCGEGPDGRGDCFAYDAEHPDYLDDPETYRCHACRKVLTDNDQ